MQNIVFDLEWNMGYPKTAEERFDEIIEFGAVRVDGDWKAVGDSFTAFVSPTFHHTIHHHVRKMLPFDGKQLRGAGKFPTVFDRFRAWCGDDPRLISWGDSDITVLQSNLQRFGIEAERAGELYDLQAAYGYLTGEPERQIALKDVVEALGLTPPEAFHDAANDAASTALVGIALTEKYGALPDAKVVLAERARCRAERIAAAEEKALRVARELVAETGPLSSVECGPYPTVEEFLRHRSAACFRCPACEGKLSGGTWQPFGDGYLLRAGCQEHGWYYSYLSVVPGAGGLRGLQTLLPSGQRLKSAYFTSVHATERRERAARRKT